MLTREKTVLAVIDVQGNLARAMFERKRLFRSLRLMIRGAQVLDLPILWTEQMPEKLGPTVPEISTLLHDIHPESKTTFSCAGCKGFMDALQALGRCDVLLTGIEAHVCVYQTAADLIARKCRVEVVADAVSSRTAEDRAIGIERMRALGAGITSVETVLFEIVRSCEAPEFRQILSLVKEEAAPPAP